MLPFILEVRKSASGLTTQSFSVQPSLCTRKFPNNFLVIYKNSIKEDEASIEEKKKGRWYFPPFSLIRMVYFPLHDSWYKHFYFRVIHPSFSNVITTCFWEELCYSLFFVQNFFFWRFFYGTILTRSFERSCAFFFLFRNFFFWNFFIARF